MAHKQDCTEKAYEIMMKQTTWKKPKRMTPKRQKAIDSSWKKWKIYRHSILILYDSRPCNCSEI